MSDAGETETAPARTWSSVDELLGPAPLRFFGEGYRRTRPRLHAQAAAHEPTASALTAWGAIAPAGAWSVKNGAKQRPHLATTDVIALAAQAAGTLLAARLGASTVAQSLVTEVHVRASDRPLEDDLERFPVNATVEAAGPEGVRSRFAATVGPMTATGTISHPPAAEGRGGVGASDDTTREEQGGPYGSQLATRAQRLTELRLVGDRALARSTLVDGPPTAGHAGLETAAQPAYCLVDAFVATLQLGQVLLYDLDGTDRAASHTLWMRRTTVTTNAVLRARAPVLVEAVLEQARVVERDGEPWRLADIVGELGTYRVRCAVAHRIAVRGRPLRLVMPQSAGGALGATGWSDERK